MRPPPPSTHAPELVIWLDVHLAATLGHFIDSDHLPRVIVLESGTELRAGRAQAVGGQSRPGFGSMAADAGRLLVAARRLKERNLQLLPRRVRAAAGQAVRGVPPGIPSRRRRWSRLRTTRGHCKRSANGQCVRNASCGASAAPQPALCAACSGLAAHPVFPLSTGPRPHSQLLPVRGFLRGDSDRMSTCARQQWRGQQM